MFNFAARPLSEHTAKPIDGFKRGTGPFISNLQYIKTCYRIKYYQKLSIVDIASQGVRSTWPTWARTEPPRGGWPGAAATRGAAELIKAQITN